MKWDIEAEVGLKGSKKQRREVAQEKSREKSIANTLKLGAEARLRQAIKEGNEEEIRFERRRIKALKKRLSN